jgi:tryptophan 2,3-dioxygenase
MLQVFRDKPEIHAQLAQLLQEPTVYDAFLRLLARRGHAVPAEILERDVTQAWTEHPELIKVFKTIYEDPHAYWELYEACEDLVDIEDAFQLWRFRHLRTVQRTIGMGIGTGGSSGAKFLERALSITFFPELFEVRTRISAL